MWLTEMRQFPLQMFLRFAEISDARERERERHDQQFPHMDRFLRVERFPTCRRFFRVTLLVDLCNVVSMISHAAFVFPTTVLICKESFHGNIDFLRRVRFVAAIACRGF